MGDPQIDVGRFKTTDNDRKLPIAIDLFEINQLLFSQVVFDDPSKLHWNKISHELFLRFKFVSILLYTIIGN